MQTGRAAMEFLPARATHCAPAHDMMQRAFTPYVLLLGGGPTAGPYPWLAGAIERGDVFLGLDGSEIVGIVTTTRHAKVLVIDQLGVDPRRQGEGIGGWLLERIELLAREQQFNSLALQTAEMMTDLLRLYSRHGFVETHRLLPEHGDDDYLRVHMSKQLSD